MNQTLLEQYIQAVSTNELFQRNQASWDYLLQSYMGGLEYKRGGHLTRYVNETENEYWARIGSTHLENHCKSVISTYVSFLFREEPHREFGSIEYDPLLPAFLEDADLDGRSFDAFMKELSVWSSVFGHSWVLVAKPDIGAVTRADEIANGVRPYVSLITPLAVYDWTWSRQSNGRYELVYFKYAEEANDSFATIKEWTKDSIKTITVSHKNKVVTEQFEEVNGLGLIPAVLAYNHRSPVRGIGVSDISDIADAQRFCYNMTSEVEQSVRINGHPALVKTPGTEAAAGAGAIIQMEDNLDPGLKPYMLTVSTNTDSIYNAIKHVESAIDKMANTGSIRSTESRRMSGVAQEQEFQLLNARLSEKADNIELAEEHIWELWCLYQGLTWDGKVEYPDSFNIRDVDSEVERLVKARTAATDPRVLEIVDQKILEMLGEDPDMIRETVDPAQIPAQPPFDVHVMINPETGEEFYARTEAEHLRYAEMGYVHKLD